MAFTAKKARIIDFCTSKATNLGPGTYNLLDETTDPINVVAFNSNEPRKFMEPEKENFELDEIVRARYIFADESELIKQYVRKPVPDTNFESAIPRLPTPSKQKEKIPDPGYFYQDPVQNHIQKIYERDLNVLNYNEKKSVIKKMRRKYFRNENRPSIPGKMEKFGYTQTEK